jgi:hypothetical protein
VVGSESSILNMGTELIALALWHDLSKEIGRTCKGGLGCAWGTGMGMGMSIMVWELASVAEDAMEPLLYCIKSSQLILRGEDKLV